MNKYYKLKLNCARVKGNPFLNVKSNYGLIEYLPVVRKVKTLFGSELEEIEYNGLGYVIAEKKDDYFEDIILDRKIKYDPHGIKNMETLEYVPTEKLIEELNSGLTCFEYENANNIEVANIIKQFQNSKNMIRKYKKELDYVFNKDLIKQELDRRGNFVIDEDEALKIIDQFKRAKKK